MKNFLLFTTLLCTMCAGAQLRERDSLLSLLQADPSDTVKVALYNKLAWNFFATSTYKEGLDYATKATRLAIKTGYRKGEAESYNISGVFYTSMGNYARGLDGFLASLRINESLGLRRNISRNLMNIGIVQMYLKNYDKSLGYLIRSTQINQELRNHDGLASCYLNLALVYRHKHDYKRSLDTYRRGYELSDSLGNAHAVSSALMNMGIVYQDMANDTSGAERAALKQKALEHYYRSIEMQQQIGDSSGVAHNLGSISIILTDQKKFREARQAVERGFRISSGLGARDLIAFHHEAMYILSLAEKNYRDALKHFTIMTTINDSLRGEENQRTLMTRELQYEFDKKEQKINAEKDFIEAQALLDKKHQQMITWSVAAGLAVTAIFAMLMFNRFRVTAKQKRIIEQQKDLVDEKNREISESIRYARRLQQAILPSDEILNAAFPENFILYRPRDVVAGDFYWLETIGNADSGRILFAVADCTGHGVPGAMVSVVCSNALNQAVTEFGLTVPGEILDRARELVIATFQKNETQIRDGMDISLLAIDKQKNTLQWAGANNPLFFISPDNPGEVIERAPDKQPVGLTDNPRPFTTHTISYVPGTVFYLFSDGLADQFGGPRGKKLKTRAMKELLARHHEAGMDRQKQIIEQTFDEWKGKLEQVDDVCIVGLRL